MKAEILSLQHLYISLEKHKYLGEDWDCASPGSSLRLNLDQAVAVLVHNEQITLKSWRFSVSIYGGEGTGMLVWLLNHKLIKTPNCSGEPASCLLVLYEA